jgi:hypothetical protein
MPTAANSPASPPPHILVLLLSQAYEETIEPRVRVRREIA